MRCNRDISLEFESFIASLQTNRQNNILKIGVSLQFDNELCYIVQYISVLHLNVLIVSIIMLGIIKKIFKF